MNFDFFFLSFINKFFFFHSFFISNFIFVNFFLLVLFIILFHHLVISLISVIQDYVKIVFGRRFFVILILSFIIIFFLK